MNIKSDERHYYIKGLLRQCKLATFGNLSLYGEGNVFRTHKYQLPSWPVSKTKGLSHNEVIDEAIKYITDLEAEVEKLQYVARIIEAAKEKQNY